MLNGSHVGLAIVTASASLFIAACSSRATSESVHFTDPTVVVKCYGASSRRGVVSLTEHICIERRFRV